MQQFCKYGSVRGATGNRRPYRDPLLFPSQFWSILARKQQPLLSKTVRDTIAPSLRLRLLENALENPTGSSAYAN